MSTVRATSAGPVSGTTQNLMSGLVKAFCHFNPSTGSIVTTSSFNVSSTTYNTTGQYTLNLTTSINSPVSTGSSHTAGVAWNPSPYCYPFTNRVDYQTVTVSGSSTNPTVVTVIVVGASLV